MQTGLDLPILRINFTFGFRCGVLGCVMASSARSSSHVETDDDVWCVVKSNYVYLSDRLRFNSVFTNLLYERGFLSRGDMDALRSDFVTHDDKVRRLLIDVLSTRPPEMFSVFCEILKTVGQPHVVDRLTSTGNTQEIRRVPQVAAASVGEMEMLKDQVVQLHREKKKVKVQLMEERKRTEDAQKEMRTAREETRKAKEETSQARQEIGQAKIEAKGERLKIMALEYEKSRCPASHHHQINDSLPSWTQWNVHIPHDSVYPYNRMGEIDSRLVVGGYDGILHVLTYEHDKWNKFVRKNGDIRKVVCHQGVCLVCVKDEDKDQFVIEQFYLNEDKKWRFLTVLPNELQSYDVSVALHNNSLYVVGGMKSWERVNTARVYDLHSGHWYKMDDLQTKRSGCSSVIINNTVFVGGGWTGGYYSSNIVECADVRDRKWRTIPSTTTYDSTITSVSNRLVGTGGMPKHYGSLSSNIVELYDEKSTKWLSLPHMTHKQWGHAAFSTQNGELITVGGRGEGLKTITSIESLKCP